MITAVLEEEKTFSEYLYTSDELHAAYIATNYAAYGPSRIAQFWKLEKQGSLLGAVAYFGESLTIAGEGFDPQELRQFVALLRPAYISCGETAAKALCDMPGMQLERLHILRYLRADVPAPQSGLFAETRPPLSEVFALLQKVFELQNASYEHWLTDVSHKVRHGIAAVYAVRQGKHLASTAGVYHRNSVLGVLGSVATDPAARGHGYAGTLVLALCALCLREGLVPAIVSKNEYAAQLYQKLGFTPVATEYKFSTQKTV